MALSHATLASALAAALSNCHPGHRSKTSNAVAIVTNHNPVRVQG